MKIIYYILIFLIFSKISFAQTLPDFVSASPEAAILGSYAGPPVNLSIGQINYTIPIYNIKLNDFEFPLTITYHYGGFKPDTDPTMLGVGWTANFSGGIIRQIRGAADDSNTGTGYFDFASMFDGLENKTIANQVILLKKVVDEGADLRPDLYIVNTPTLTAKYQFTKDKEAIFMDYKNYILCSNTTETPIVIKSDQGIIYEFSEAEETETDNGAGAEITSYISSWMLTKIKLPNGTDSITFEYDDYYVKHNYYTRQWGIKDQGLNGVTSTTIDIASDDFTRSKIIKKINYPNGYIIFNNNIRTHPIYYINDPATLYVNTQQVMLQSASIYNNSDTLIKKYIFDYTNTDSYYYFLNSIKEQSQTSEIIDYYSFDYYNLSNIPIKRISNNKVDYWGYYNGRDFSESNFNYSLNPDYTYSITGALSKITYPTKGYCNIDYEANNIVRSGTDFDIENQVYTTSDSLVVYSDGSNDLFHEESYFKVPFSQYVEIKMEAFANEYGDIIECTADSEHIGAQILDINNPQPVYNTKTMTYWFDENDSLRLYGIVSDCSGSVGSYAKITVKYRTLRYEDDINDCNIDVGGIRVSRTIDYPINGEPITTKYNYFARNDSNPSTSSGYLADWHPTYKTVSVDKTDIYAGFIELPNGQLIVDNYPVATNMYRYYKKSIRPLTPLTVLGSNVYYTSVEILKSDGASGKTINDYDYFDQSVPYEVFPDFHTDIDYKQGKLIYSTQQQYKNNYFTTVKYEEFQYEDHNKPSNSSIIDTKIMRYPMETTVYDGDSYAKISTPDVFYIATISENSKEYNLVKTKTVDKNNDCDIINETIFKYNDENQISKKITHSSLGDTIINEFKYPSDINTGVYNSMVESNMLVNIVEQINTVDGDVTKSLLSTYKSDNNTFVQDKVYNLSINSPLSASEFDYFNGTDIDDHYGNTAEVEFVNYDNNGNPLYTIVKSSLHTVYLWGYQHQYVIAKIENTIYSTVEATLGSNLINNLSSSITPSSSDMVVLNTLRNTAAFSNSLITTYTFKPLVGMTSMTDPRGLTTTYEYDSQNRLDCIKDNNGKIIKKYDYHYAE
jgi:YD repeat-containing protein